MSTMNPASSGADSATLAALNVPDRSARLEALRAAVSADAGGVRSREATGEVNNHVHTTYSFSPYSPSAVAWAARCAGLQVVGSVDHDSIGAALEMRAAAEIVGMGATVGAELRVSFAGTAFADRRLNNPDTIGNAYIVLHGVPRASWPALAAYLEPVHRAREERNREQLARLNALLPPSVGPIDYERDVRSLSMAEEGGSVTERHILYALSLRLIGVAGDRDLSALVADELGLAVGASAAERINDALNPHRGYDLLGILKAGFVPRFFVQPGEVECPPVEEVTHLATELGAIAAYAYLGDIAGSVTGDKADQTFEDGYLDELFDALPALGFVAVTYMPPRNTREQLRRVQELCARYDLVEISGVDINSSRQTFHCPEVLESEFRHLIESTWALVGHEAANGDDAVDRGLFGSASPVAGLAARSRLAHFADIGRASVASARDGKSG